jgi:hypothetical protein
VYLFVLLEHKKKNRKEVVVRVDQLFKLKATGAWEMHKGKLRMKKGRLGSVRQNPVGKSYQPALRSSLYTNKSYATWAGVGLGGCRSGCLDVLGLRFYPPSS